MPRIEAPKIIEPKIEAKIPPAVLKEPPQPVVAVLPPPTPVPPAPARPVQTGMFGPLAANATAPKIPLSHVQTGGFGDPQGFPGQAKGESPGNVPKLGSFDLPDGPGRGNGTGGSKGSARIVASAGFGDGGVGSGAGPRGSSPGTVKTGGFVLEAAPPVHKQVNDSPSAAEIQAVEILFKPMPQYTEEARRLGVQGDVILSVVFLSDGTVKILGVVKSLGHGLDQKAVQAASQIRFKPAQQAGKPTDFAATLRIEFRLA
jgi:TonB family protein